ncbi:unnamed protein product [Protopolystoma xenopodis]|uniref:Uncharacterized protein n=1 Tax=Protopolystoma xenopodis TaxID=117903 RepID=A0A448WTN4_9PLAT|nr:unnamed protein product [Protopolystoma xenopodis]
MLLPSPYTFTSLALYYNACMFLSYQCLTLGKLRLLPLLESLVAFFPNTPNLASPDQTEPRLSGSNLDVAPLSHTSNTRISPWLQLVPQMEVVAVSTCVLVPKLRHSGIRVLEDQIARQKLAISSALLKADGFKS